MRLRVTQISLERASKLGCKHRIMSPRTVCAVFRGHSCCDSEEISPITATAAVRCTVADRASLNPIPLGSAYPRAKRSRPDSV